MAHRKPNLPEKICAACGRPFAWRRKWARDWDSVRYCSDACRSGRRDAVRAGAEKSAADRVDPKPPGG
ncbi:DUF2256 domain-containing protein [Falsiroseomonas sp.]|uniref:DUF2256 domain-containing protein n=1 Tax=Falsiroseomonas sp. TaxID=2870721 RepID=UPI002727F1CE|nr:DUF2256 domain-containing protein [Falsiroseomonas sp.]MDO9501494.1 DUF2256 domain-containing protein [Falsiroseomonas sp.]MDP3417086.1 DUF2256 domain-containing protein [Falsiroseomonas sp.]